MYAIVPWRYVDKTWHSEGRIGLSKLLKIGSGRMDLTVSVTGELGWQIILQAVLVR